MAAKKKSKKLASKLTPEDRESILEYLNKSRSCVNTVLECGSDWSSTLHEVDSMGRSLGRQLGFKQEHWYSEFK